MEDMKKEIKILEEIIKDTENDARYFDGRPFDGKNVAAYFGNHGAAIAALAGVVKSIIAKSEEK